MPDKILSAISPAYGIATGSGPYRNLLGVFGRKIFDKQKQRRENKEASEAKAEEMANIRRQIASANQAASQSGVNIYDSMAMKSGGRVKKNIDGRARKGKTRGRII